MNIKTILTLTCCILLPFSLTSIAQMTPVPKHRVGTPPSQVLKEILQTNLNPDNPPQLANHGVKNQAPRITWLADSNPSLAPHYILPASSSTIYAVRNLANQLTTSVGSVDYGILTLHTPLLLITASSDNDAILTLLTEPKALPLASQHELHQLFTPFKAVQEIQANDTINLIKQRKILIEKNIDYQINLAMQRYSKRIRAGRLMVVGAILDTNNTYKHGTGRLIVININGDSGKKLKRNRILKNIPPNLLQCLGREITD